MIFYYKASYFLAQAYNIMCCIACKAFNYNWLYKLMPYYP
jgi:hypothetical protein